MNVYRYNPGWKVETRYVWVSRGERLIVWLCIGGRKPLAHLSRWRRLLLHVPSVRWRLWPKPLNFNGRFR